MTEENMNLGEGKEGEQNQPVNVQAGAKADESESSGAKTMEEIENEASESKKTKNLISAVILLAGLFAGSLFVDAAQFFSGSGYSERALKKAEIFEAAGKTWVSYTEPIVRAKVITVSDEGLKDCPRCDAAEVVSWLRKFVPTVVAQKIDVDSDEGKKLIEEYNINTIPSFLFDSQIKDTEFYSSEAKILFGEKKDKFLLNTNQLGLPVGKYLETPTIGETDPVMGNRDAKLKIVVFSDLLCPYCKLFYTTVTKVAKQYGDQVALAYKEFPLESIHKQARSASIAALCANEQGKYWEMADQLFASQQEWSKTDKKDIYKTYAKRIKLDSVKFDECLDQDRFNDKIDQDMAEGNDFGVSGTPAGFVGTEFVGGVVKEDELKKMIEEQLQK